MKTIPTAAVSLSTCYPTLTSTAWPNLNLIGPNLNLIAPASTPTLTKGRGGAPFDAPAAHHRFSAEVLRFVVHR